MTKDQTWHGIPREEIPWYPTINAETCIGCGLCFTTCGRNVFNIQDNKSIVENALDCMVGCSTCANVCPVDAITFPSRDLVWKLERERKIFKVVRQETNEKKDRLEALKAQAIAEEHISQSTTRTKMEVAGEFGEKQFLVKLEELIRDRPYDFINLRLDVPTVKGALEKTPSFMSFEVTSTEQEDIQTFSSEVRALIANNGLTLVSEHKLG
jgi:NAD-dependent dihydropyrimidine dehydrogenase PreA subunit